MTRTFLYYARAIDAIMLLTLGLIATQQAEPSENTMKLVKNILAYSATHPNAIITYCASDMVLSSHSDASYLSESKARSRTCGHFFMTNESAITANNGAVVTISQIIKAIVSSASEAELGTLSIKYREAIPARHALEAPTKRPPMEW